MFDAVLGFIFGHFWNVDNVQPEVTSDVSCGVFVRPAGMKVRVNFGDCRSNRSRDTRLPHFLKDDERRPTDPVVVGQNAKWRALWRKQPLVRTASVLGTTLHRVLSELSTAFWHNDMEMLKRR